MQRQVYVWRHRCHYYAFARRWKDTCWYVHLEVTGRSDDMFLQHWSQLLGILPRLLSVLHSTGILTEDLSLSSDANENLECTYRGLCIRPGKPGQDNQPIILRRIGMSRQLVTGPGLIRHNLCWYRYTRHPLGESGRGVVILHGTSHPVVALFPLRQRWLQGDDIVSAHSAFRTFVNLPTFVPRDPCSSIDLCA